MFWNYIKDKAPESYKDVIVVKRYRNPDGEGWEKPFITIDHGWNLSNGRFEWRHGGQVLYWMQLGNMPKIDDDDVG